MMLYLLDTNIVSYFIKGNHPKLSTRMKLAFNKQDIAISAITRAEIRYGQALMASNDKRHKPINLLLEEIPTLPWTTEVADHYGQVKGQLQRQGTPIGEMDTQIAAHALAENLILVTHNTKHFDKVSDLKLEDWMG